MKVIKVIQFIVLFNGVLVVAVGVRGVGKYQGGEVRANLWSRSA